MMKKLLFLMALFAVFFLQAQNYTVSGNGTTIPTDGTNIPDASDDTSFGSVNIGSTAVVHTFTITNNNLTSLFISDNGLTGSTNDFSRSSGGSPGVSFVILGLQSETFEVTFDPISPTGIKAATLNLVATYFGLGGTSNISINFAGTALPPALSPSIDVSGLGVSIVNGDVMPSSIDDTDFGNVTVGGSETHTFTITNTGTAPLNLTGSPLVITPGGAGAFVVTNFPTTPIPAGSSSTFDIEFSPPVTPSTEFYGTSVIIQSDDPNGVFYYNIEGYGVAVSPEIEVSGLGNPIGNPDFSPSTIDDTKYGNVALFTGITHTFTITNRGTAPLNLNGAPLVNVGGTGDFLVTNFPTTPIPVLGSTTFDVTFTPSTSGYQSAIVNIDSDDVTDLNFVFLIEGTGVIPVPEMDITGLGNPINNGDLITSISNDTDFGSVDAFTGSVTHIFTIENTGTLDLNLTDPSPYITISGIDAVDFTLTAVPVSPIAASGNTTFSITFDPTGVALTTRNATVSIANDDADENPYTFAISGTAIDVNAASPFLITQYYEGTLPEDRWIEVKNISTIDFPAGSYYLCLYKDSNATKAGNIESLPPQEFVPIEAMVSGQVRLYSRSGAVLPTNPNLGITPEPATEVCSFNGNDVILISESASFDCYNDRLDIMGIVVDGGTPPNWGKDKSFIKGCGTSLTPSIDFAATTSINGTLVNDYLELTLAEVNNANSLSNIALGTQNSGATTWTTSWDNGVPDKTRTAVISGIYTADKGSIAACDLTITGYLNMDGNTTNYVEANRSFTNTGTVIIGDQESLYTVNNLDINNPGSSDVAISGSITKIEYTTSLNDVQDYTYWSSPVRNQNISAVFPAVSYDQNRIYYWDQAADNLIPNGGDQLTGEWINAAGETMKVGQGYISQGPISGTYPGAASVQFTGVPNSGDINSSTENVVLVWQDDGNFLNDMNLIGNPYPSAIDADAFILESNNFTALNGTIWFWSHKTPNNLNVTGEQYTNDDYAVYNLTGTVGPGVGSPSDSGAPAPEGYIASGQGFVVMADNSPTKTTFTDAMRVREFNTQFYRGTDNKKASVGEKERVWLNAKSSKGGAESQILIAFLENATDGKDKGYDGIKISEGWVNLYSKIDTLNYGIQALGSFNLEKKVPLAFDTYIEDLDVTYSISIDRFEGASLTENAIYLVDNELNVTHDLKQGAYDFSAAIGSYEDRFTLQFTKATLGVDDFDLNNDFVVINEDDALLVKSKTIVKELKMYDVTGRLLVNMLPNESEFRVNTQNIRKGTVLILNTTFDNGTEISKKAIKY
ncbi:choice-of-anchor D domain-containing protein [Aureibaculum algae]|uniref:Choice-of-anchor D domain-containing protein n=1 Tax=Aureibaculum algae TaxID=2584122 RepID=A0A5B7TSW0_9FLAO|nr:choice-of-anchor D domain-containing protein [Aureibaculum algae]QCX38294.1 choice-of-anchor D domain-containing protein [Aureibaculum algae]